MILSKLVTPVQIWSLTDAGVDLKQLQRLVQLNQRAFAADEYLLRQTKTKLLKKYLEVKYLSKVDNNFWEDYYLGNKSDAEIFNVLNVPQEIYRQLRQIKASRYRLISEFIVERTKLDWHIVRVPHQSFKQTNALVSSNRKDYRITGRKFKELPENLLDENLLKMIKHVANQASYASKRTKMKIIVHHTIVFCQPNQTVSNSPEGIHQDGMDFIVSAMVVDRVNVKGGKSIIYGSNKETSILEVVLQPGHAIFQADLGTELWHEVTPIEPIDTTKTAYRSTIGFDIQIL